MTNELKSFTTLKTQSELMLRASRKNDKAINKDSDTLAPLIVAYLKDIKSNTPLMFTIYINKHGINIRQNIYYSGVSYFDLYKTKFFYPYIHIFLQNLYTRKSEI